MMRLLSLPALFGFYPTNSFVLLVYYNQRISLIHFSCKQTQATVVLIYL